MLFTSRPAIRNVIRPIAIRQNHNSRIYRILRRNKSETLPEIKAGLMKMHDRKLKNLPKLPLIGDSDSIIKRVFDYTEDAVVPGRLPDDSSRLYRAGLAYLELMVDGALLKRHSFLTSDMILNYRSVILSDGWLGNLSRKFGLLKIVQYPYLQNIGCENASSKLHADIFRSYIGGLYMTCTNHKVIEVFIRFFVDRFVEELEARMSAAEPEVPIEPAKELDEQDFDERWDHYKLRTSGFTHHRKTKDTLLHVMQIEPEYLVTEVKKKGKIYYKAKLKLGDKVVSIGREKKKVGKAESDACMRFFLSNDKNFIKKLWKEIQEGKHDKSTNTPSIEEQK